MHIWGTMMEISFQKLKSYKFYYWFRWFWYRILEHKNPYNSWSICRSTVWKMNSILLSCSISINVLGVKFSYIHLIYKVISQYLIKSFQITETYFPETQLTERRSTGQHCLDDTFHQSLLHYQILCVLYPFRRHSHNYLLWASYIYLSSIKIQNL